MNAPKSISTISGIVTIEIPASGTAANGSGASSVAATVAGSTVSAAPGGATIVQLPTLSGDGDVVVGGASTDSFGEDDDMEDDEELTEEDDEELTEEDEEDEEDSGDEEKMTISVSEMGENSSN